IPLVCFVDGGAKNVGLQLCPFSVVVIDPELDGINLFFRQLRHGLPSVSGSTNGNGNIAESGGSAASGDNSSSGRVQARAIDFTLALLVSNLHGEITVISSARQNAHDAVIRVTIEIGYHRLAAVIFRAIRRSVAKAPLCLKIEENRS